MNEQKHHLGLAAVLSFLIPGLGQIYKQQVMRGIFYFLIVTGLYFSVILFPLGLFAHLFVIIGASKKIEQN